MEKSSSLSKITTRAKQLRRKNKNIAWIAAIKKASKELKNEGAIGAKKKTAKVRQTGASDLKRDRERSAQAPGKRIIKDGRNKSHAIYVYRKNRSDKPGSLTGADMYSHRDRIEKQIKQTIDIIDWYKGTDTMTRAAKKPIIDRNKKYLASLKKQLREQNSHISRLLK